MRGGCASAPRERRGGLAGSWRPAGLRLAGSVIGAGGLALLGAGIVTGPPTGALAAPSSAQSGTFWIGNVGHDPGTSTDPHLDCADLALRGSDLAATSGTFQIIGWPPSGSQTQDYPLPAGSSAAWTYDTAAGGVQQIAVVSEATLVAGAEANGDTPKNGQLHFKVDLVDAGNEKHLTFWLDCSSSSSTSSSSSSSSSSQSSTSSQSSATSTDSSTTTSTTSTTSTTQSSTTTQSTGTTTSTSTTSGGGTTTSSSTSSASTTSGTTTTGTTTSSTSAHSSSASTTTAASSTSTGGVAGLSTSSSSSSSSTTFGGGVAGTATATTTATTTAQPSSAASASAKADPSASPTPAASPAGADAAAGDVATPQTGAGNGGSAAAGVALCLAGLACFGLAGPRRRGRSQG